mmetsp:Transcript_43768/g.103424  ORF Transcript_43768/g.103424 Transcript_43768/m.103424 type:complete len:417 (+) Transcript_43768:90-1340(+)
MQRVAACADVSIGGALQAIAGRITHSSMLRAPARRAFAADVGSEKWEISASFGKSTVTQELWRRREQQSVGIGGSHAVLYKFSKVSSLRDEYVGNTGKVLVGRMLEDLDALAGNVANDWCQEIQSSDGSPLMLVTAAVDKIRLARPVKITEDVVLSGRAIWTGNSSMLVRMYMQSETHRGERLLEADFVYVARDRATLKSVKVPQVEPANEEEEELFRDGEKKAAAKRGMRKRLSARASEVQTTLEAMVAEGHIMSDLPSVRIKQGTMGKVLMNVTARECLLLTKPQERNTAGRVFGGFLMRECYNLAFATCFAFSGLHPVFIEVTDFVFGKAVQVGSLLQLKSRVIHTSGSRVFVEVLLKVIRPVEGESFDANKIVVVYDCGAAMPEVVPATKGEALAKLHALEVLGECDRESSA